MSFRAGRPYRTHPMFHHQHRDRDRHLGHRLGEVHQSRFRRRHLGHHRNLDVGRRIRHPLGEARHLGDLSHRHQPDDLVHLGDLGHRHQPDDLRHPGVERLGDPCLGPKRMGYYLGGQLGVEYPCPVPRQKGCYPGVECRGLRLTELERQELPPRHLRALSRLVQPEKPGPEPQLQGLPQVQPQQLVPPGCLPSRQLAWPGPPLALLLAWHSGMRHEAFLPPVGR